MRVLGPSASRRVDARGASASPTIVDLGAAVAPRSPSGVTSSSASTDALLAFVHVEHRAEQLAVVDHDVVAEEHRERLVAHVLARHAHRVAEAERVALADVVDVGEVVDVLHLGEQVELRRLLEVVLELEVAVEVVLDGALARDR